MNKKLLKTVAVASLVGLSTVNLIGCKEKVEEVKIIKEQEVEQKETIKIDDMEVTMAPLSPSLQLELPTEPPTEIETKEETISQFEKTQEEIEEERIGNENAQKEIEKMNTQTPPPQTTTGTDKNGRPYLQPGAQYTFGADGLPIEAPPVGKRTDTIINPNNGQKYTYSSVLYKWMENHVDEQIARENAIRDGKMDSQGNTNVRKLTEEEMDHIAEGIARAMGD